MFDFGEDSSKSDLESRSIQLDLHYIEIGLGSKFKPESNTGLCLKKLASLCYLCPSRNYGAKKFYNIRHSSSK